MPQTSWKLDAFAMLLIAVSICAQSTLSQQSVMGSEPRSKDRSGPNIDGGGSTEIYPLMKPWIDEYTSHHPGIKSSYRALGSTAGIRWLIEGQTSFAVTDRQLLDAELTIAKTPPHYFPIAVHAVVPIYNLPNVPRLRFSGSTLAGIFIGKITKWNDPSIATDNAGVKLPQKTIKVMHFFPNGNVESSVMGDYLAKVSPAFKATLSNASGGWPLASEKYKGALGVLGFVSETPGGFGCVWQSSDSEQYEAAVKNFDGAFVKASVKSLMAATIPAIPLIQAEPQDFRVSITNAPGTESYPIASFIWLLLSGNSNDRIETTDFLKWVLTDGQKLALKLGYPQLPEDLVKIEMHSLEASPK